MSQRLKDYLHLYLGCSVIHNSTLLQGIFVGIEQPDTAYIEIDNDGLSAGRTIWGIAELKPILRRLESMTEAHWREFATEEMLNEGEVMKFADDTGIWIATSVDEKEFVQFGSLDTWEDIDFINEVESADPFGVISCSIHDKSLHFGTDLECLYHTGIKMQASFLNWLRKNGFDCDDLIDNGLAIEAATLNKNRLGGEK